MLRFAGVPHASYRANEQLIATLGGAIGILATLGLTGQLLDAGDAVLIVPSLGASAVLLFAVPHSPLAQPWAVFGGHVISALVGVACVQVIPDTLAAAALAVGLAIGAMHLTRCIHPPGGATALAAVIGSPALQALGFGYALVPIALNVVIILLVGIAFNCPFPWRRYPVSLMHYAKPVRGASEAAAFTEMQIEAAMAKLNVVLDITAEEVAQIFEHARREAEGGGADRQFVPGRSYCNDLPGPEWAIRQIIDERPSEQPAFDLVVYRVVSGARKHSVGSCTRSEFAAWARSEVHH
ncbi:MAG: HPP family protein [Rhodocyclaceae bacterium]|nr:HPP family protein [Rhodocyclaceae bacterium]